MGFFSRIFKKSTRTILAGSTNRVYVDGDRVACEKCGKSLEVRYGSKQIALGTPETMAKVALKCQRCGFVTCTSCALPGGATKQGTLPVCPGCGSKGGPYLFATPGSSTAAATPKDYDDQLLAANPISRNRMRLLWLEPNQLTVVDKELGGDQQATVVVGEGPNTREYTITRDDLALAKRVEPIIDRAYKAAQSGKYEDAIQYYQDALLLAPGCDLFLMSIGSLYARMGQKERGIKYLKRAAEISPDNPRIKDNLISVETL